MAGSARSSVRRHLFGRLFAMVFIATIAGSISAASAQDYPTRPIRLLHGFAAGGAADTLSRILANGLSKRLGQPIVIEAKPGSGGNLAAAADRQGRARRLHDRARHRRPRDIAGTLQVAALRFRRQL